MMCGQFEQLDNVKDLLRTSSTLGNLDVGYQKKVSNPDCDKHNLLFGGDDRFKVFSVPVWLTCYTGYYGNSGCSTFASVDNKIAAHLLNRVLNKNRSKILQEMAELAKEEAIKIRDKAKAELDTAYALLDSISEEENKSEVPE